jgi:hypothetical protein
MSQATTFDSILAQCRDLVCDRLADALSEMLDNADDAVTALINQTRDAKTQKVYQVARNKAAAQRETIVTQFRMRFLHEFQARGNRVKKIGDKFDEIDLSSLELELVAEDDLNETLKFNAMAGRLRQYCDEELVALDQRIGVLLGDANLQAEDNPFTPQAICDAYKQTCRQIDTNVDVRMIFLTLFDDHVLDAVRAVYKAANALLVQNEILPKIRFSVSRGKDGATPVADKTAEPAPAADKAGAGEQDLFAVLQNLVANNLPPAAPGVVAGAASAIPGAGAEAGGPREVVQGAELLRSLTRLQLGDGRAVAGIGVPLASVASDPGTTNILQELKATSFGSGMNQMDVMTLNIMAMLFDQLFDDPNIPAGVKGLIGRLQIPMLKVAIADKSFFSKKTHPARLMLDTLGEVSARLPADVSVADPQYGRLESILQELIVGYEDDIAIFDVVRGELDTLIAEEDRRVEQETLSAAKQIAQDESLALAKTVAQAEIKIRVRASKAPRPVIEFLVQQWVKLLLVVQVKDGEDSEAWRNALETTDLLLWSVEPKESLDERRKLVASVPGLLKRLADGLAVAGVDDAVRMKFFSDLRRLHSETIGRSAKVATADKAETPAAPVEPESAPAESVPEAAADVEASGADGILGAEDQSRETASTPALAGIETPASLTTPEAPTMTVEPEAAEEVGKTDELSFVDAGEPAEAPPGSGAGVAAKVPEGPEFADMPVEAPAPSLLEPSPPAGALDGLDFAEAADAATPPAEGKLPEAEDKSGALDFADAPGSPEPSAEQASAAGELPEGLRFDEASEAVPPAAEAKPPLGGNEAGELSFIDMPAAPVQKAPTVEIKLSTPEAGGKPEGLSLVDEPAEPEATARPPRPVDKAKPEQATPEKAAPEKAKADAPSLDFPILDFSSTQKAEPAPPAKPIAPASKPAPAAAPAVAPKTAPPAPRPTAGAAASPSPAPSPAARPPAAAPAAPARAPASKPPAPAARASGPAAAARPAPQASAPPARPPAAPGIKAPAAAAVESDTLDFSAALTVKNPFGEGEVQVDDLDFTAPATGKSAGGAKPAAEPTSIPPSLAIGSWVEIRDKGATRSSFAKLSFVSPLKTRYLFVNRQGQTVLECSRDELSRRFKFGELTISVEVAEVPLFDRIAEGLVGKLGGAKASR